MNKSYQNLLEKHTILSEDFENLKVKYEEEHKRNQELTEEQKNKINLSNIWQSDHNRLMKIISIDWSKK